jgi:Ser/Thr protein kinase RdoA (MazF antagonist)
MRRITLPLSSWNLEGAQVQALSGGTANANYRVKHKSGTFFLRQRSPRYIESDQIAFDHGIMRHLTKHGIIGPNPLPTREGTDTTATDDGVYELHRFVDGVPLDWNNPNHLAIAGKGLRTFHNAMADFSSSAQKGWPRDDSTEASRIGITEIRTIAGDPAHLRVLDELAEWCNRIDAALPDADYWALPTCVIHGDFHPGNLMIVEDRLGLFDLDCASHQAKTRDLADAFLYVCARRDGSFDASTIIQLTRECRLEPERNRQFLAAYGPITDAERAALPWLVAARWIHSRIHGRKKLPESEWLPYATEGVLTPLEELGQGTLM